MVNHPLVSFLWFRSSSCSLRTGYGVQVGAQDPPPYPPTEAFFAFIPASAQVAPAFHYADAPLHSRSEAPRSPKPSLLLVALALCVLGSLLGQRHSFDPHLSGGLFVRRGVHSPIRRHQPRRASELPQVILQSWQELLLFGGVMR